MFFALSLLLLASPSNFPTPNTPRTARVWRAEYPSEGSHFSFPFFQINQIIKIPKPAQLITVITEQIFNTQCMRGTLLGSLHRLSHLILTMTLCKVSAINIILIFTDKETDGIQILLIYLDHLLGIRLHAFILIILFQKSFIEHPLCQFGKYCYSYDKTKLEVVT